MHLVYTYALSTLLLRLYTLLWAHTPSSRPHKALLSVRYVHTYPLAQSPNAHLHTSLIILIISSHTLSTHLHA